MVCCCVPCRATAHASCWSIGRQKDCFPRCYPSSLVIQFLSFDSIKAKAHTRCKTGKGYSFYQKGFFPKRLVSLVDGAVCRKDEPILVINEDSLSFKTRSWESYSTTLAQILPGGWNAGPLGSASGL